MNAPDIYTPLFLSLKVACLATLISLIAGVAFAFLVSRRDFPGREVLDAACTLPLVLPPTVLGYYLLTLLGRNGIIGTFLQDWFGVSLIFTWKGAVIAASIVSFPLLYKSARAALEGINKDYEDAARTLGVSEWGVFFRVSLPLAWPSILAGVMLAFARALGEFGVTLMVAGNMPDRTQTLPLAIYSAVQAGDDQTANILAGAISALGIVILVFSGRLLRAKF
ncbi:MAG: molybdate ABC transporter permease subunit [Desulfurivibrionaceae bacterium]